MKTYALFMCLGATLWSCELQYEDNERFAIALHLEDTEEAGKAGTPVEAYAFNNEWFGNEALIGSQRTDASGSARFLSLSPKNEDGFFVLVNPVGHRYYKPDYGTLEVHGVDSLPFVDRTFTLPDLRLQPRTRFFLNIVRNQNLGDTLYFYVEAPAPIKGLWHRLNPMDDGAYTSQRFIAFYPAQTGDTLELEVLQHDTVRITVEHINQGLQGTDSLNIPITQPEFHYEISY